MTTSSNSTNSLLRSILLDGTFSPSLTSTPKGKKLSEQKPINEDQLEGKTTVLTDHQYACLTNMKKKKRHITANKKRLKTHQVTVNSLKVEDLPSSNNLMIKESFRLRMVTATTRNVKEIVRVFLTIPSLRQGLVKELSSSLATIPETMRNKKTGFVSVLMMKDAESIKTVKFGDVIEEMQNKMPEFLSILMSLMLPKKKLDCSEAKAAIIPKLAMIYGIILQNRNHELSLMQRLVSICLADNICDQAVYDRLNRLGVSSPYCVTIKIFNDLGKNYPKSLADYLKSGKFIRFVGDNLNFSIGTRHESIDNHKHMVHMFVSTALIFDHKFLSKPQPPEILLDNLTVNDFLLSTLEYYTIRNDVADLLKDIAVRKIPQLSYLKSSTSIRPSSTDEQSYSQTKIVPLPCLPYNEQYYQDDVKILEWYQKLCEQVIAESGADQNTKFNIGGDQLTRERFTGAMLLRLGNIAPTDRFDNIGRCTFEFFHLGMNFLEKAIFGELWNENGKVEKGTLRGECERVSRKTVDSNIMKAYDADKRFVLEYLDALAAEAITDYFGMEDTNDYPTKHVPPTFSSYDEKDEYVNKNFRQIVDEYIYPAWSGKSNQQQSQNEDISQDFIEVQLGNSSIMRIPVQKKHLKSDKIKDYAHFSLEVCFTFKYFLNLVKCPDRAKMLGLLKVMMVLLRGHSQNAKYPKEILRMLVQQYSIFGFREACQIFHSCFVNLHGKHDSHVPADLVQEWNVKESKKHIKHMYSNKTESNIVCRTSALPAVHEIADNFDKQAGTIVRAKRHKEKEIGNKDELHIMDDIKSIRPFLYTEGRFYEAFKSINKSLSYKADGYSLRKWIGKNQRNFDI